MLGSILRFTGKNKGLKGLFLAALVFSIYGACAEIGANQSGAAQKFTLRPGDNIQEIVSNMPEGTMFILEPGIYRMQSIIPKDRQQFIGKDGTRLVGARILADWTKGADNNWTSTGLPRPLYRSGSCGEHKPLCNYREDLFVDGVLYERVGSIEELGPNKWTAQDGAAFLSIDPLNKTVELGVTPAAFSGSADGVLLQNITVEKYASEAQQGAIDGAKTSNWTLIDVSAIWNHGGGLDLGRNMKVRGGSYSHNGQIGIIGDQDNATVDSVEIAYNNYAQYDAGWEAGGTKFSYTNNLTVRNSCVHHNYGPGLWTDIDNRNTLYENNVVFANKNDGIKHEISYKAIIRNNVSAQNGQGYDIWGWGSQILVQNSSYVEVYDNVLEVGATAGNGLTIIHQERGSGEFGEFVTTGNVIRDNLVIYLGKHGLGGMLADHERERFYADKTNILDGNRYIAPIERRRYWENGKGESLWHELQASGTEVNGTFTVEKRAPMEVSCKKK